MVGVRNGEVCVGSWGVDWSHWRPERSERKILTFNYYQAELTRVGIVDFWIF